MKDNPKNMPAIDTGSRFSAHPIATNTQMEGIRQMSSFHILLLIKQGAVLLNREISCWSSLFPGLHKPAGQLLFSHKSNRAVDGLEKRMVSEQIQIKAERMFCGTFFRCSVERTEIVIQPVQFVFAQVRQCFGVTFPGEELGVPDH